MYDDQLRLLDNAKKILFVSILYHIVHSDDHITEDESILMEDVLVFIKADFELDEVLMEKDTILTKMEDITTEELFQLMELIRLAVLSDDHVAEEEVNHVKTFLAATHKSDEEIDAFIKHLKEGDRL